MPGQALRVRQLQGAAVKRDLDLVRKILLWMEAQPEGHNINWTIEIDGHDEEAIGFHAHLMEQAGLIVATECTTQSDLSPAAIPVSITWDGYEFLGASKDNKLWTLAREKVIGPAGGVAFTVLLEWLKVEGLKRLGLPP